MFKTYQFDTMLLCLFFIRWNNRIKAGNARSGKCYTQYTCTCIIVLILDLFYCYFQRTFQKLIIFDQQFLSMYLYGIYVYDSACILFLLGKFHIDIMLKILELQFQDEFLLYLTSYSYFHSLSINLMDQ